MQQAWQTVLRLVWTWAVEFLPIHLLWETGMTFPGRWSKPFPLTPLIIIKVLKKKRQILSVETSLSTHTHTHARTLHTHIHTTRRQHTLTHTHARMHTLHTPSLQGRGVKPPPLNPVCLCVVGCRWFLTLYTTFHCSRHFLSTLSKPHEHQQWSSSRHSQYNGERRILYINADQLELIKPLGIIKLLRQPGLAHAQWPWPTCVAQVDDSVGWILCHGNESSEPCAYSCYSRPHGNCVLSSCWGNLDLHMPDDLDLPDAWPRWIITLAGFCVMVSSRLRPVHVPATHIPNRNCVLSSCWGNLDLHMPATHIPNRNGVLSSCWGNLDLHMPDDLDLPDAWPRWMIALAGFCVMVSSRPRPVHIPATRVPMETSV